MTAVAALVLAAGQSTRMGPANKLLMEIEGEPLVARAVAAAMRADRVYVVVGHEADAVRRNLAGRDVEFVHNPDYALGLSTSLTAGIKALDGTIDGVLVCLADMPWVSTQDIDALIVSFDPDMICLPVHEGRRGNPVLWPRRYFAEILALDGDQGARRLIHEHADKVREIECGDGTLRDIDMPKDACGPSGI